MRRAVVVGAGLAGLAAALDLAQEGLEVVVLEARPRLGGATWSAARNGREMDNGQHVFLRCCTAYREFLERIGAAGLVAVQKRLAVPVVAPGGRVAWIRRGRLPAPAHLGPSLLGFSHLPLRERVRAALLAVRLRRVPLDEPASDGMALGDWLAREGAPRAAIDGFWDLLVRPTLNIPARRASLALAAKVFQTGFLGAADAADIGWAEVPFEHAHARPARRAIEGRGGRVFTRCPVRDLHFDRTRGWVVRTPGGEVTAALVVLAVPHEAAARLLPEASGVSTRGLRALGRSAIVNLHFLFDRRVTRLPLAAGWRSEVQWVFDRTRAAGIGEGQYLTVSLSAAEDYLPLTSAALRERFGAALAALFPRVREARLLDFHVVREPAATFEQRPGTRRLRPGTRTALPGLYLAGAWTDTGWPATMEGAVRSGRQAAAAALADLARCGARPARAA